MLKHSDNAFFQRVSAISAAEKAEELPQKAQKNAEMGAGCNFMQMLREVHS